MGDEELTVPNDIKVGVTLTADYLMASKDMAMVKVGTGAHASAQAKQQSLKNKQDDLVFVAGIDVYRVSASKLATPKGKMPAVGEMMTLFKDGQEIQGVVVHLDQEKSTGRKVNAKAVGTGIEIGVEATKFIFSDLIKALSK